MQIVRILAKICLLLGGVAMSFNVAAWFAPATRHEPFATPGEKFNPRIAGVATIDEVLKLVEARQLGQSRYDRVYALEQVLRDRFYHGYSRYSFNENWAVWLAARLIDADLDAKVSPDQILRHPWAACSQQAIVVQAALERMGIPYATIEQPAHFSTAAWIDGEWLVVDPHGPRERDRSRLFPFEKYATSRGRMEYWKGKEAPLLDMMYRREPPRLVKFNQFPAQRALRFHRAAQWISDWLWLALLGLSAALSGGTALGDAFTRRVSFHVRHRAGHRTMRSTDPLMPRLP